jgi:hypothetical protein
MNAIPRSRIQRVLQETRVSNHEWLSRPDNASMIEEDRAYIASNLDGDGPGVRMNVSDSLMRLGRWHAVNGEIGLLDGHSEAWSEIHRAWLYESLALRIRVSEFQKGRVLGQFRPIRCLETEAIRSTLILAYAMMVRREFETEYFGETVRVMLLDKTVVPESHRRYHGLGPFLIQMLALLRKTEFAIPSTSSSESGPYQRIIEAWNQPQNLAEALHAACDFHCRRIKDTSKRFFAEFRDPPFDLVPAEILAVYTLRRALGLETPRIEHPLVEAPFAAPTGGPSEISDELISQIEDQF